MIHAYLAVRIFRARANVVMPKQARWPKVGAIAVPLRAHIHCFWVLYGAEKRVSFADNDIMQIQKDDIRRRIMVSAKRIFLRRGFTRTSMRDIAADAGVGVGNIYNYFDSKDVLFRSIVAPVLSAMDNMLTSHHDCRNFDVMSMLSEDYLREAVAEYIGLIKTNRTLMTLLLFRAQGSSLESFRESFTDRATLMVREWFVEMRARHPEINTDVTDFTIHLHTVWEFALFEEIIMHDIADADIDRIVEEYVRFEVLGWRRMLGI